ncbi:diguanylate cyclase [Alteromonas sp. S015]|uniref:diguanylate cyclase n=1 Tax=Alteromonas sp. S015 TaxID=3117401 RepID=UPI002FE1B55C
MLRLLLAWLVMACCCQTANAANFNNPQTMLSLDSNVVFAVSDSATIKGNEEWLNSTDVINRSPLQYLHFKVRIYNQLDEQVPVWFSISFPAIKTLVVTDGNHQWETGDSMPYSTRTVNTPNYHFPSVLKPLSYTEFTGTMSGEILRYSFSVATPQYYSNLYMRTLQRDMAFFGAMGLLTVLSALGYIASRNLVFLSFASFIFATTFWFFRVFGYAFELLWPNTPSLNDISYAISIYFVLITAFWVLFQTLARDNHRVYGAQAIKLFCAMLPLIGLLLWQSMGLDIALKLPVILFFPYTLIAGIVIFVEYKRGSDRAKWLAAAMLPVTFSALMLSVIALFDVELYLEPVATFMTGLVMTCLFMVALTASYMVKVIQRERDAQKEAAQLKSEQTSKLEALVKERTLALEQTNSTLAELASKDSLTELPNRRTLDMFVDNTFVNHLHQYNALAIALIDLDHFKSINDTFGHDVGDEVLKGIANILAPLNDEGQVAARYGGEEFAIAKRIRLTPTTHSIEANAFAKQLEAVHCAINQLAIASINDRKLGACIGWTLCKGSDDIVEAFRRADKALYVAKDKGRNLIVPAL